MGRREALAHPFSTNHQSAATNHRTGDHSPATINGVAFEPMKKRILAAVAAAAVLSSQPVRAQGNGAAELAELVRGLGVNTRVLMIGAHPDDEDTQLLTWLARGRHVETAYLSLTRGDGGQNLIGN